MRLLTDRYFTVAKKVAEFEGMNPIVSYRIFSRSEGLAALEPLKTMVAALSPPDVSIAVLPEGVPFQPGDTLAVVKGRFIDLVEQEPLWLWWSALPCHAALQSRKIVEASQGRFDLIAFENRHNFGAEATALTSYGAKVGGIEKSSCEVGCHPLAYLRLLLHRVYLPMAQEQAYLGPSLSVGTMPHAALAIFRGDYEMCCKAYLRAFPFEKHTVLNDYNNKEIEDSLLALKIMGDKLDAVRADTCGENYPQTISKIGESGNIECAIKPGYHRGVSKELIRDLRKALDLNGGTHVRICATSGFDAEKTSDFADEPISVVGTGSFIPRWPMATADIFEVDGEIETKKGREWGISRNERFWELVEEGKRNPLRKKGVEAWRL